jgi:hypothetical protein
MAFVKLHRAPDDPFIPEGIPIPGPRPNRSDHPPVKEPYQVPLPPAKEPPAPPPSNWLAYCPSL